MHGEVMLSAELGAKPLLGNVAAISSRTSIIPLLATLLLTRFLSPVLRSNCFLPTRFLPGFFRSSRFLSPRFLSPCFRPRRFLPLRLLLCWHHFSSGLCFLLSLFLLIRSRRPSLILPLRFFLSRVVFLLFFVLRVKNRRTRDQSREDS